MESSYRVGLVLEHFQRKWSRTANSITTILCYKIEYDSHFIRLWWWFPLRLSKRQSISPQIVLLRTTLTRTIIIYRLMKEKLIIKNNFRILWRKIVKRNICNYLIFKATYCVLFFSRDTEFLITVIKRIFLIY